MASSVKLHPRPLEKSTEPLDQFPSVIQTPAGLAILELQGTINLPETDESDSTAIPIGRLSFPDYHPDTQDSSGTAWMKRVHLFIGQNQRLTGEVKKLPKAIAILRKRHSRDDTPMKDGPLGTASEDLEVFEIVKYKLMFSHRPEPVGTS
ncbi:chromosome transmission fidelity protein 8 [Microdochium trichocladiopsis]|uniref:Chromosome transmission fidelity protein 8 n=1 Tax=Microdochium trichocladiopsis TaxID=1682393 RepID=A0A9P8YHU6_9PEZI|nr:chromosome transmission fidelity protein 8 [Microdochium trichocladiopsis]KAH7040669.1 chromosome transmission fidelity protein 8 [Microdochium trichocladiopsis]